MNGNLLYKDVSSFSVLLGVVEGRKRERMTMVVNSFLFEREAKWWADKLLFFFKLGWKFDNDPSTFTRYSGVVTDNEINVLDLLQFVKILLQKVYFVLRKSNFKTIRNVYKISLVHLRRTNWRGRIVWKTIFVGPNCF